jgi:drug/metabolite transporter (DMT)-like permease
MNSKKENNNFSKWKFLLMMTLMVVVWALAFPLIKISLDELSFINLTIMRFLVACIVVGVILLLKKNIFSKLHRKDVLPIFILGFFGIMIYHLSLNYGEGRVSPGAASLIVATIPVFIVIFAVIFLKEKIALKKLFGVIFALLGVLVIYIWGRTDASFEFNYIYSVLAVFLAAISGAFYTIAGKKLLSRYTALSLTVYAIILGSIGLIPFLVIQPFLLDQIVSLSPISWISIIFLGVFSTVIGYLIWYVALEIKTASEISVYLYVIPVFSTIISYFWLGIEITMFFILGGMLVIAGLIIVNKTNKKLD